MMKLLAELKRRQMFRVAAAYAVVAWLILQVVNNLAPGLNLPNWAITLVIVLLGAGFPIALLFCWIQQLAPGDGAQTQAKVNRIDYVLVGGLAAVIALLLYQQFAPATGEGTTPAALQAQTDGLSIAVMPFDNLSDEREQEFFSVGMSDEIMTALAKVQSLSVVARESAHQYKGERNDMRAVGRALNAQYLINGSVRRAGSRVRITAQLVRAEDGVGLWTDSFDRELTDIFAIQEDIARAIVGALRVPLGLQQGELLVSNRSIDPESYQQFLRARALVRGRGSQMTSLAEPIALLEQIVARHDNYAPAWALLALAYDLQPQSSPAWAAGSAGALRAVVAASQPKADAAAQQAVRFDPALADGYLPLALVQQRLGKLLLAEGTFAKALALDSNNADVLLAYSNFLTGVGRLTEGLAMKQQARALEPFTPVFTATTALTLWLNGQNDAAEAMAKELSGGLRANMLASLYVSDGRYNEAADALVEGGPGPYPPDAYQTAIRIVRDGPSGATSAQALPLMSFLGYVHLRSGTPERALEEPERNVEVGYFQALSSAVLWHPVYASVRKTERFKTYVRKAGFIDYWRARGWPDLCRPVGTDDFECE